MVVPKGYGDRWDALIGQTGVVSHHLRLFLGAIELIILRAFVCIVGYCDVQITKTLVYN